MTDNLLNIIDRGQFDILEFDKPNTWMNKVTIETNKNDSFHYDMSYLTAVTYLNDDFEGGEFEYILEGITYHFKPIKNVTLIMDKTLFHRVLPVQKGVRYSLITFFNYDSKNKKTLL